MGLCDGVELSIINYVGVEIVDTLKLFRFQGNFDVH